MREERIREDARAAAQAEGQRIREDALCNSVRGSCYIGGYGGCDGYGGYDARGAAYARHLQRCGDCPVSDYLFSSRQRRRRLRRLRRERCCRTRSCAQLG